MIRSEHLLCIQAEQFWSSHSKNGSSFQIQTVRFLNGHSCNHSWACFPNPASLSHFPCRPIDFNSRTRVISWVGTGPGQQRVAKTVFTSYMPGTQLCFLYGFKNLLRGWFWIWIKVASISFKRVLSQNRTPLFISLLQYTSFIVLTNPRNYAAYTPETASIFKGRSSGNLAWLPLLPSQGHISIAELATSPKIWPKTYKWSVLQRRWTEGDMIMIKKLAHGNQKVYWVF